MDRAWSGYARFLPSRYGRGAVGCQMCPRMNCYIFEWEASCAKVYLTAGHAAVGASDHAASADDTKSAAPASPELTTEVDGTWICSHCSRLNEKPTGKAKTQNLM